MFFLFLLMRKWKRDAVVCFGCRGVSSMLGLILVFLFFLGFLNVWFDSGVWWVSLF